MVDFTVMIRVLVIIPYKELEEGFLKAIDACECEGVEFTLAHFYGTNPGDIDPASKYDIVVARGMTYYAMRMRYPSLHIIALDTSANGLMEALDRVLSEYGRDVRVGCIVPEATIADENVIRRLSGFDVSIHEAKNEKAMSAIADELIGRGYDVLVGGGYLRAFCEMRGIRFSGIGLEDSAILRAVKEAIAAARIMESERLRAGFYRTIMEELPFSILAVDRNMVVLSSNAAADSFFSRPLLCTSVSSLFPEGLIEETIEKNVEMESVQRLMDQDVIISQRPISSIIGGAAIISIQTIAHFSAIGKGRRGRDSSGLAARYTFSDILTDDISMRMLIAKAIRYAQSDCNVLITGETGTGKELMVQSMHNASRRKDGPFVAINCASISPDLLESELFGYVEGAFTGAMKGGKAGLFELAHGGTIFLDEIGELPVSLQAKLLRVLQEEEVRRVGGSDVIPVDVRVMCATNQDIPALVEKGLFRSDLYYRINLLTINMPPLRKRPGDISQLFLRFIEQFASEMSLSVPTVGDDALSLLRSYGWPGNIRELRNVAQRILILNGSRHIDADAVIAVDVPGRKEDASGSGADGRRKLRNVDTRTLYDEFSRSGKTLAEFAAMVGISRTTLWRRFKDISE